ncbi:MULTISPECIES: hypothetical protein [Streptomyces]|uniref:Uncharacterized protein n=1 Tax=Streptomyces ardesiacus TaxID=285564 RepID=A0ABW8HGA4_9ACTN|nr:MULTISPECIES: hypothetical protein [Streptomyces]KOU03582.1 hypothetical protein ADK87_09515 [Streptomyces sp. NRRL F-4711]KOX30639.1 hypothetical protein ADL07_18860 [Streptomyces sp. NRRL F-4707]KOX47307.1 hypothetical protein ADL09_14315 [Streptomyces sp. NRRL F-7442]NEB64464.1 hypothetical protein [Streptomyces diastaticus]
MVTVAVLLLPGLGLLLFSMTYLEDRLFGDPGPPRHARRRHLRLIPGGRSHRSADPRPQPAQVHATERDAA